MPEQTVVGGAVAKAGERLGRVVAVPVTTEHVDGVDGAGTDGVGDAEEVILAVAKDVLGVVLRPNRATDVARARQPPPGRVELGDTKAVVIEKSAHVGVGRRGADPDKGGFGDLQERGGLPEIR